MATRTERQKNKGKLSLRQRAMPDETLWNIVDCNGSGPRSRRRRLLRMAETASAGVAGRHHQHQRPGRGDTVDISTKIPGRVIEIVPHEGDMVSPGEVTLIDTSETLAQLHQAQASAELARQTLVTRQAEVASDEAH